MPRDCPKCNARLNYEPQTRADEANDAKPEHWWCVNDPCDFEEQGEMQPMSLFQQLRQALSEDPKE